MQIDNQRVEMLKNIDQRNYEWISTRRNRISSSLLRKAITNTESILDSMHNDEFFSLITIGMLVETLSYNLMPTFMSKTGLWVDSELPYIVGSPDGICTVNEKKIPVEIKSTKSSKSIKMIISEYYYQIQSYISFLNADKLLLIYYEIDAKKLNCVLVHKDAEFKQKYYPLVERSYWKFLAKEHFTNITTHDYFHFLKKAKSEAGILKYYTGNFEEKKSELKVPPKFISYEVVKFEDILEFKQLEFLKSTLKTYESKLNFEKLNELTGNMFYNGKESYIKQKIEETEAFLGSVRRYFD